MMSRPSAPMTTAQQNLAQHLVACTSCQLVASRGRQSLAGAGCAEFQALMAEAYPQGVSADSPLRSAHLTEEAIEDYHFGRLSGFESRLLQRHTSFCDACAVKLHNELMFIYSLKAALKPQEFSPNISRTGAAFESVHPAVTCNAVASNSVAAA